MARKRGGLGNFEVLWARHESLYCSVFLEALGELDITGKQRKDEDAISEALCPVLRRVCFRREGEIRLPEWERPIAPEHEDSLQGGKIRKRPDFTCSLIDPMANAPETYEISFHVECKRLGTRSSSWNLNKNYVHHGVCRFDCTTHKYGQHAISGMMIGYMVNMDFCCIQTEINGYLSCEGIPQLSFQIRGQNIICEQRLNRTHVQPSSFKLIHLWADLRN